MVRLEDDLNHLASFHVVQRNQSGGNCVQMRQELSHNFVDVFAFVFVSGKEVSAPDDPVKKYARII